MLDYSALAALAAVIREGSFERAALALHVTPSAVSQRIRLLEERVGCALVVREQPCRATETGRRLCQHVDRVCLLEQDLRSALPALAPQGITRVNLPIAVNADSLATWFAPMLASFAAQAPVLVDVAVDDQDHTTEWLRSGAVLAAVTGTARPAAGCNSQALGAMRYIAAASPAFMARHFASGVGAGSLAQAPSLVFNTKDELQARWVRRLCHRHVELPRHTLPSPQAFVTAAVRQHSTMFTARPPREVSLYFTFMSAPVSRMVLMTLSRLTWWVPSPCSAMRAALMALTDAMALRSMHGICTSPPTGSQVRPRWCSMPISAAFSTCAGVPPITAHKAPAAIAAGHAHLALTAHLGPADTGVFLVQHGDGRCREQEVTTPSSVALGTKRV
jgi:LysR family transcriptional regulator (chromosome initiation inhibitor)